MTYLADFSLALINRTGAYYVCRDILRGLPEFFSDVRYWRFTLKHEPRGIVRKMLGRAMLVDLDNSVSTRIFRTPSSIPKQRTLYFDPLYVLFADLHQDDIVLCHDVGPASHPYLYDKKVRAHYEAAYGKIRTLKPGVVFVSTASQNEFCTRYGGSYRFLKSIPLYVRDDLNEGFEEAPVGVQPPFFLTVAALETRKNHLRVMEAFLKLGLHDQGYSYVFCGPNGNSASQVRERARQIPGVVSLGYLKDSELRWLYRRATGFILPSLLEGFGVPALEAAQFGALPLVSGEGAQREAVGDSAVFVDPFSVDSIAEGLLYLINLSRDERTARLLNLREHAVGLSYKAFISRWSELLSKDSKLAL